MHDRLDIQHEPTLVDYSEERTRLLQTLKTLLREFHGLRHEGDTYEWDDIEGRALVQIVSATLDELTIRVILQDAMPEDAVVSVQYAFSLGSDVAKYGEPSNMDHVVGSDHVGCMIIADSIGYVYDAIARLRT